MSETLSDQFSDCKLGDNLSDLSDPKWMTWSRRLRIVQMIWKSHYLSPAKTCHSFCLKLQKLAGITLVTWLFLRSLYWWQNAKFFIYVPQKNLLSLFAQYPGFPAVFTSKEITENSSCFVTWMCQIFSTYFFSVMARLGRAKCAKR